MPLIRCPDCGRDVSPSASSCLGCGRPMGTQHVQTTAGSAFLDPSANARSCLGCVAAMFLVGIALAMWTIVAL